MPLSRANDDDSAVAAIVRRYLARRGALHLDGVGTLRRTTKGGFELLPESTPSVFIGYAHENLRLAKKLARALRSAGFRPWLDREMLMPGQNWKLAIERAIESADFAVQCFSTKACRRRRSYFYHELRIVLDAASRTPLDQVFLLPVRLEDCELPATITSSFQYLDLFPDWDSAIACLVDGIRILHARRGKPL